MSGLDSIRSGLTDNARAVINAIWDYDLEKEKCIPTAALSVQLGQAVVTEGLRSLNGSIVVEHSGDGRKRCCLTFLGALMSRDGEQGEELLKRLLEFIQRQLLADPEFQTVESESVRDSLSLTDDEFRVLSHYYWLSPFTGGGGGQKSRWSFGVPYYVNDDLPLETDLDTYVRQYALRGFDSHLPVLYDERTKYQSGRTGPSVTARVFYSWQSDLPNATNRGLIGKALEDAAKSIREDGSIAIEPVIDRDTAGVPGSPDIASTILDKIERADVFVCDISIINLGAGRPTPNPNVLIELGYALKVLGPDRIVMVLNSAYGSPELLPFDLRMRRVIPYEMREDVSERAPTRRGLQLTLAEGLRTIFGGFSDEMPGELIEAQTTAPQIDVSSFLSSGHEEFEAYVTRLLTTNNEGEFNIVLEKLRDATVPVWDLKAATADQGIQERILSVKNEVFLPALRKVVLLSLLLIKFSGPVQWFDKIADLFEEIFLSSHRLTRLVPEDVRQRAAENIDELANHTVPASEALIATYLVGGYELSRKKSATYTARFFPRVVDLVGDPYNHFDAFYLFWPIHSAFWQPNRQRDLLALDRYGSDSGVAAIIGGEEAIRTAILQMDCLVAWHSFISQNQSRETETVRFFSDTFPAVSTMFVSNFTHEQLGMISPFIEQLWQSIQNPGKPSFVLDNRLAAIFEKLELSKRKRLLARFVVYAEKERSRWMWSLNKMTFPQYWPPEIQEAIKEVHVINDGQHSS
jgi:hypothetical protein